MILIIFPLRVISVVLMRKHTNAACIRCAKTETEISLFKSIRIGQDYREEESLNLHSGTETLLGGLGDNGEWNIVFAV